MTASQETLLYMNLYQDYKAMILSGRLKEGARLPSIRQCALDRQISRTTVEMAYMLLAADGYILSKPQSGYYVTGIRSSREVNRKKEAQPVKKESAGILYDFTDTSTGQEGFNLERWRRYMKSALRQEERLLTYGDARGESDLREALCEYLIRRRNVVCSPQNIVIGAGFQSLLHILCPLLDPDASIWFADENFEKGKAIFADHGFLECGREEAGIYYVTPSHMNAMCDSMPIPARHRLLHQAAAADAWIIEDDYDSEFAYAGHPAPSLQGLDGGLKVIYMGTFSRVLLPSIRISFMILPDGLLERYEVLKDRYNQTVSKADQIALCQYIRDGHLLTQLKRTRKFYEDKNERFLSCMEQVFKQEGLTGSFESNGMVVRYRPDSRQEPSVIASLLLKQRLKVGTAGSSLWFCGNGVREDCWEEALKTAAMVMKTGAGK